MQIIRCTIGRANRGDKVNLQLIQIPYDSGHESLRTGRGPDFFIERGVEQILRDGGHQTTSRRLVSQLDFIADIEATFELNGVLAREVQRSITNGMFPFVLAGACHCSVGVLGGIGQESVGMIWFDAHGDFNTPETTLSGLLDGMGLAMATGRCWKAMLKHVPGFVPIPEEHVIHVGGRDYDVEEEINLRHSGIRLVEPDNVDTMQKDFAAALEELSKHVKRVYIHMDLDVLDLGEALANHADSPGGVPLGFVLSAIRMIKSRFEVCAGAIGSFDPDFDRDDKVLNAGFEIIKAVVGSVD